MDRKNPNTDGALKPTFPRRASTSTPRCMRFPDVMWTKLTQDAKREDIPITELLRRIVDLYYARTIKESQASERFLNLEARVAKLEASINSVSRGLMMAPAKPPMESPDGSPVQG